ncbi:hypothetical protein ElyMa_005446800 [Elysia marginata]|uniref:ATP-dependent DNA helicase RecQ zinc-binding domain-containing protein n=1 Tax=Elysia marginata TaxID=1093978 RepID=A0AAV4ENR4_9GAST|nr:hypothetical protein ElyMa_005446800 [Elysia marginata]
MGPPCQCKRLKCFEVTSEEEKMSLLDRFNSMPSKNEQDAMIASLISVEKEFTGCCDLRCRPRVFTEKFNIAFGYPRKDTCSTCDAFEVKLKDENLGSEEIAQLVREKQLHVLKGQVFYDRN